MTTAEKSGRRSFRDGILVSWGIVTTLLLLVMVIGGALYFTDLQSRCDNDETDEVKREHIDAEDGSEDIYMSKRDRTILNIKKNSEGAIVLISDVDYNTKISATYITKTDKCYLTSGEDLDWYAAWNDTAGSDDEDYMDEPNFKDDSEAGGMVPDLKNKVTDMSILPRYIRPYCEGKAIYWLIQPDEEHNEAAPGDERRVKRSYIYLCITWKVKCPYTRRLEKRGHKCYHYIYQDDEWSVRYVSYHCKNWDLVSLRD